MAKDRNGNILVVDQFLVGGSRGKKLELLTINTRKYIRKYGDGFKVSSKRLSKFPVLESIAASYSVVVMLSSNWLYGVTMIKDKFPDVKFIVVGADLSDDEVKLGMENDVFIVDQSENNYLQKILNHIKRESL